jgi:NAD(P)-dependent dehydrogenase (short-subunit alcohol dehydrogenase family)
LRLEMMPFRECSVSDLKLGFNLCEQFAAKGCLVFATARRLEAMDGLEGMNRIFVTKCRSEEYLL